MFLKKIPTWLKKLYPSYIWNGAESAKPLIYLTFDDGPHPQFTPFVLEQLAKYNALATFFCVGSNVVEYPEVYEQILQAGHSVGNHTYHHLKGSSTPLLEYVADVQQAQQFIDSKLFRPPYGRIKRAQAKALQQLGYKIVMWSVIPGDWEADLSQEDCLENVLFNIEPGDIVVLHDSQKAWENMSYVLPRFLEYCKQQQWLLSPLA